MTGSLPFRAAGKLGGLTLRKQFQRAFAEHAKGTLDYLMVGTFNEHVAPLIHRHCAACHCPGQPGPFPLLTYEDARRRGPMMERVVERGYMPPWLPEPAEGAD